MQASHADHDREARPRKARGRIVKYASKEALLSSIESEYETLRALVDSLPARLYREPGVWGDAWTITDLIAHLAEWQRMFLRWFNDGLAAKQPEMPAPGYKWNETPRLNRAIRERHRDRLFADVNAELEHSHAEILALVRSLSPNQLLESGHFAWTGRNPLATYLGANTASHYRFAVRVLERWLRKAPART